MLSFRKRWLFLALFVGPGLLAARSEDASPLPTCAIVLPAGTSLFCPPLPTDGRLDGALGTQLAGAVDKITLWLPGTTNTVSLRPNSDRAWTDESGMPYPHPLEPGQGFIIHREADAPVTLVFTGLFATTQHQTLTLPEGMSMMKGMGGMGGMGGPKSPPTSMAERQTMMEQRMDMMQTMMEMMADRLPQTPAKP